MRLSRRARLGLILILCLSAGLAGWRAYRATEPTAAVDTAALTDAPGTRTPAPDEPPVATVGEDSTFLLTPEIRDLEALAEAGDPQAACQLGVLLSDCRKRSAVPFSDEHIDELRQTEKTLTARGDLKQANDTARYLILAENYRRHCRDLPSAYLRRAPKYLRQAALAGNRHAQVSYLRGDGFMLIGAVDASDFNSPEFNLWRSEAISMLQAMMREGRPEAVLLLLEGHSYHGSNLGMIVPPDPTLDQAYLQLARRLFSDFQLPDYWPRSSADARAGEDAKAMARRWHAEHFASRQLSIEKDLLDYPHPFRATEEFRMETLDGWKSVCRAEPGSSP